MQQEVIEFSDHAPDAPVCTTSRDWSLSGRTAALSVIVVESRLADHELSHTSLLISLRTLSSLGAAIVVLGIDHNYSR